MALVLYICVFFFFNEPATTEIYTYLHTLSLHDALPISTTTTAKASRCSTWRSRGWDWAARTSRRWSTSGARPTASRPSPTPRTTAGFPRATARSEEHTSELQSLMRISYAVFCLKKKKRKERHKETDQQVI